MENFQKNVDKMKADEAETDAPVTGQPALLSGLPVLAFLASCPMSWTALANSSCIPCSLRMF